MLNNPLASFAKVPKDASGAFIPKPIKLKNASVKIACGTNKVNVTNIDPKQLGIKCLNKILVFEAPRAFAARTNSCCFNERISPLTILAIPTQ